MHQPLSQVGSGRPGAPGREMVRYRAGPEGPDAGAPCVHDPSRAWYGGGFGRGRCARWSAHVRTVAGRHGALVIESPATGLFVKAARGPVAREEIAREASAYAEMRLTNLCGASCHACCTTTRPPRRWCSNSCRRPDAGRSGGGRPRPRGGGMARGGDGDAPRDHRATRRGVVFRERSVARPPRAAAPPILRASCRAVCGDIARLVQGAPGVADGLAALRADWTPSCVCHMDLRLDNVLVPSGGSGVPRIVDWESSAEGDPGVGHRLGARLLPVALGRFDARRGSRARRGSDGSRRTPPRRGASRGAGGSGAPIAAGSRRRPPLHMSHDARRLACWRGRWSASTRREDFTGVSILQRSWRRACWSARCRRARAPRDWRDPHERAVRSLLEVLTVRPSGGWSWFGRRFDPRGRRGNGLVAPRGRPLAAAGPAL